MKLNGLPTILFFLTVLLSACTKSASQLTLEITNPEYSRPPEISDNLKITAESSIEDVLRKADFHYATHNHEQAIALLERASKMTDDKTILSDIYGALSSNYLEKALVRENTVYYESSIRFAKKSLEITPNNWQVLANLGSIYANTGDHKQAIFYFSEAQKYVNKNDPNYEALEYHRRLSEEIYKKGNLEIK